MFKMFFFFIPLYSMEEKIEFPLKKYSRSYQYVFEFSDRVNETEY